MNRPATETSSRSRRLPAVDVLIDRVDTCQSELRDLIRRMHTGRWPLYRCLAARTLDGVIYEAVEHLRAAPPRFSVVRWRPDGLGLSWMQCDSSRKALEALRATNGW